MKTRKNKGKTYEIHDNGGRPFFVTVNGKKISVEKNMNTFKRIKGEFVDIENPPKHLFEKTVDQIFIGKKSPTGGYDGLKPSQAEGNSLLVRDGSKYIYIGHEIFEFEPIKGDIIEKYYSDIGNSDVPYPYAVGKTHVYIMLDKVAIDKSFFDMKRPIYAQYYEVNIQPSIMKDKQEAKERMKELQDKSSKLKAKILQKRAF